MTVPEALEMVKQADGEQGVTREPGKITAETVHRGESGGGK